MSEDQLYEIARKRIDRRNRRWLLLGVNFFFFLMYVGAFTAYSGIPRNIGAFFALAWMGVLVLHVFYLNVTQNRDEAIDGEVAKLREAIYEEAEAPRPDGRWRTDRDRQPGRRPLTTTSTTT